MMDDGGGDTDQFIVAEVVSGRKELFRILVQRHEPAVYAMGVSFFRNAEDAADFTQEVFLKSFRSLPRFQGRSRFSTWLYRIAYNTAVNGLRRQKDYCGPSGRELSGEEDEADRRSVSPEQTLLRDAAVCAVREAIQDLPERYRICVDLFFFYDRSYQEIELITGYPVNTIKSHVFRAKKLLRDKLGEIAEGGIE
jgi:RNA polymerase sigma-70 factor (ECF subfamily)